MNQKSILAVLALTVFTAGCTAVTVQPVANLAEILHVCIQENPKVMVSDFVPVLEDSFKQYGISTERVSSIPPHCEYVLTYSARRSWDITPYLSQAELTLLKDKRPVASANYHLRGKGGLALNKWASTDSKIRPVVDELLTGK